MKIFQVVSTGFGKQLFEAETVQAAIGQFEDWIERTNKLNNQEASSTDTVIISVRRLGTVINRKS